MKTVDAKEKVGLFDLPGSDLCHGLNWVQTAVLSQCHWDHLQSVGKGPHGILFQCWTLKTKQKPTDKDGLDHQEKQHTELQVGFNVSHLICSLIDSESTGNL